MEYVDAETLTEKIRQNGVFSVEETISISKQILNAISYAHNEGIIHRDIKTSNIMLTDTGRVKVTDFGLAKDIQKHSGDSTVTHMRAGTLYYMSPEQIKGLKNVDKRSDIYSVGMTIYEMLVGKVPFDKTESDFTIQKKIVDGKIPAVHKFVSDIPRGLEKIISKAISTEPNKRYQTAQDMLKAIESFETSNVNKDNHKERHRKSTQIIYVLFITFFLVVVSVFTLLFTDIFRHTSQLIFQNNEEPNSSIINAANDSTEDPDSLEKSIAIKADDNNIDKQFLSLYQNNSNRLERSTSTHQELDKIPEQKLSDINKVIQNNKIDIKPIPMGRLIVTSEPESTNITLNGDEIGWTNLNKEIKEGEYHLNIAREGFQSFDTSFLISKDHKIIIDKKLIPHTGKLIIIPRPDGTIHINENLIDKDMLISSTDLPIGNHILSVENKSLESIYQKNIIINKNDSLVIKIDFGKTYAVKIRVPDPNGPKFCDIYIDGENSQMQTPAEIKLRTGKHKIFVEKKGYEMIGSIREVLVPDDINSPIDFSLKKINNQ
jgi:serine/threonine protein kinase